jgi:DUF2934 family protein
MEDQIRVRAYALWEADGHPAGQDQNYWFKAATELAAAAAKAIKPASKRTASARKKAA